MSERAEITAFVETARRFAEREVAALVGTEGRDGDLSRLGAVLSMAEQTGLAASARPGSPGGDWGAWGRECPPALSAAILEELARACAGVASCVHFAGLAAAELPGSMAGEAPSRAAVAFFEPPGIGPDLAGPPSLVAAPAAGGFALTGEKVFVQAATGTEGYVVFAAGGEPAAAWAFYVPADAAGLTATDAGKKMGLGALETRHLKLAGVAVPATRRLGPASPERFLARNWLGLSAISLGNARGALAAARKYAAERYQGGTWIARLPAVRQLLAEAESRIEASAAHLEATAARGLEAPLREVAMAKLRVTTDCAEAVTDCLQVLGGYGYMEDYRLEKRLRDALTLKSMAGRPDDLRLLIAAGETTP